MSTPWKYVNRSLVDRLDSISQSNLLKDAVEGLRIMFGVDAWKMDAPSSASIGKAAITIAQFMLRPDFIPDWLTVVRQAPGVQSSTGDLQYNSKELKDFKPITHIVAWAAQSSKSTIAYAFSSLVENGFLEAALLDCPETPGVASAWRTYSLPFYQRGGDVLLIPLTRFAAPLSVGSILAQSRPAAARDHLWLKWQKQDQLTPAKIRDRWNRLNESTRKGISPHCCAKLDISKSRGTDVVKKGLRLAKSEDDTLGEEFRISGMIT